MSYYLAGMAAGPAYEKAGYTSKSEGARNTKASALLRNLHIRDEIEARQAKFAAKIEVDAMWVIQRWAWIANASIADVMAIVDGKLWVRDFDQLSEATKASIKKIKINGDKLEIEMHSKTAALEALSKATQLYSEKSPLFAGSGVDIGADEEEQREIDDIALARKIAYFLEITADKVEGKGGQANTPGTKTVN